MRSAALVISLCIAIAAPACGYSTSPSNSSNAFALDAGNYTLKISGTGICSSGTIEGTGTVTVVRSGTAWMIKSSQLSDSFAMSLTTEGAVTGSARGDISGVLSTGAGSTMSPVGTITGNNTGTNIAGGPITNTVAGAPASPIQFSAPSGGGTCLGATWTLTPR